jgi:DNA-binding XRE family transcriptional regulator
MKGRQAGQRVGPHWKYDVTARHWPYEERRAANLTIDELAAKSGISRRTIIRMEQGKPNRTRFCRYRIESVLPAKSDKVDPASHFNRGPITKVTHAGAGHLLRSQKVTGGRTSKVTSSSGRKKVTRTPGVRRKKKK